MLKQIIQWLEQEAPMNEQQKLANELAVFEFHN
jgi:hypothetical protein